MTVSHVHSSGGGNGTRGKGDCRNRWLPDIVNRHGSVTQKGQEQMDQFSYRPASS